MWSCKNVFANAISSSGVRSISPISQLSRKAAPADLSEEWISEQSPTVRNMPMFPAKTEIISAESAVFRFHPFAKALQNALFPAENMSGELQAPAQAFPIATQWSR